MLDLPSMQQDQPHCLPLLLQVGQSMRGARHGRNIQKQTSVIHKKIYVTSMDYLQVLHLPERAPIEIKVTVWIEGALCIMNTRSPVSIISAKTLKQLCPRRSPPL